MDGGNEDGHAKTTNIKVRYLCTWRILKNSNTSNICRGYVTVSKGLEDVGTCSRGLTHWN